MTCPHSKEDLVREVAREVDLLTPVLTNLSRRIHANPELGLKERKAATWCCELLASEGFDVTRPVAGLETAFRASKGTGRPVLAFLAEPGRVRRPARRRARLWAQHHRCLFSGGGYGPGPGPGPDGTQRHGAR